jgi:hypothetical protein
MKRGFHFATTLHPSATAAEESAALPFVIPSAAEGSAVPRTFPGNVFREGGSVVEGICGFFRMLLKRQPSLFGIQLLGVHIGNLLEVIDGLEVAVLFPISNDRLCLRRSKS